MLSAKITLADGTERTYSNELIEFSWLTRNNEGTSFSASVPSLSATLVISPGTFDSFVYSINRTTDVEIFSDLEGGLTLPLSVIESTPLPRKGTLEISCTGNFFTETNNIFGTLKVPAATWEETQAKFGLSMVELHEPNKEFTANVTKKEDIALAAAWSFPTRRNISVTPFTTGDDNFKNDGIGLFRNMKEAANDLYAPVYRVYAEDIIDYDVEAAQPPVTHIQTTTLGKLAPNPQIPATTVLKYSGQAGSPDISTNVRSFYIEETQLAAIYMKAEQKDSSDNITTASQTLVWSDGVQTTFDTTPDRYVIGIFSSAFVEYLNNTQIRIVDRLDSTNVIATINVDDALDLWTDTDQSLLGARRTNSLTSTEVYTAMKSVEILWFKKVTTQGYAGLWYDGTSYGLISAGTSYTGYEFVESCKVNSNTANDTKYYIEALFISGSNRVAVAITSTESTPATTVQQMPAVSTLTLQGVGMPVVTVTVEGSTFDAYLTSMTIEGAIRQVAVPVSAVTASIKGLDFIGKRVTPSSSYLSFALDFRAWSIASGTTVYIISGTSIVGTSVLQKVTPLLTLITVDTISSASSATNKFYTSEISNGRWVVAPSTIAPDYLNTPLLVVQQDGDWFLQQDLTLTTPTTLSIAQTGNIAEWAGEGQMLYTLCRGAFMAYVYMGDNYWTVYLQMDSVPFLSRESGQPMMSQRIAEGTTNEVTLAFKVGALQQDDKFIWDADTGRVEIEVSKFYVRNNVSGQWIAKDIQALNIIAMTSYVRVQLDPLEPSTWTTVKVTGFSISYEGLVTAKLSGMIVD